MEWTEYHSLWTLWLLPHTTILTHEVKGVSRTGKQGALCLPGLSAKKQLPDNVHYTSNSTSLPFATTLGGLIT